MLPRGALKGPRGLPSNSDIVKLQNELASMKKVGRPPPGVRPPHGPRGPLHVSVDVNKLQKDLGATNAMVKTLESRLTKEQEKNKKISKELEDAKLDIEKLNKRVKGGKKGFAEEIEALEKALRLVKNERDEIQEDFDELNKDFQMVREDKEKAEQKSEEASKDTSSILMTIDGLRSIGRLAFDGLRGIENAILIESGKRKKPKDWIESTSISRVRALQAELRDGLHAMNVDVLTDNEKAAMELVQQASEEQKAAAQKIQAIHRGHQVRRDLSNANIKNGANNTTSSLLEVAITPEASTDMIAREAKYSEIDVREERRKLEGVHAASVKQIKGELVKLKQELTAENSQLNKQIGVKNQELAALAMENEDQKRKYKQLSSENKILQQQVARERKARKTNETSTTKELSQTREEVHKKLELLKKSEELVLQLKQKIKALGRRLKAEEMERINLETQMRIQEQTQSCPNTKQDVIKVTPETEAAATKVQSHIRRHRAQKTYKDRKDRIRYEKDRELLVTKARGYDALEEEVTRLRDKVLTLQKKDLPLADNKSTKQTREVKPDPGSPRTTTHNPKHIPEPHTKVKRGEHEEEKDKNREHVDMILFDTMAQELEMLQAAYNSVKKEMEQERKKCVRLHRLRAAADEEALALRKMTEHLQKELNDERMAAELAEEAGLHRQRENVNQHLAPLPQLPDLTEHLHLQLRASEDARMTAVLELQRTKAQLEFHKDQDADQKLRLQQLEDQVNSLREAKRRTEMHTLRVEEALEEQAIDIRSKRRQVDSLKRQVGALREEHTRESHSLLANLNLVTKQQQGVSLGLLPMPSFSDMEVGPHIASMHTHAPLSSPEIRIVEQSDGSSGYAKIHMKPIQPKQSLIRNSPAPRQKYQRHEKNNKSSDSPSRATKHAYEPLQSKINSYKKSNESQRINFHHRRMKHMK